MHDLSHGEMVSDRILLHIAAEINILLPHRRRIICRACSSGVEHLPFKQRVGGSSPPTLTNMERILSQRPYFLSQPGHMIGLFFCSRLKTSFREVAYVPESSFNIDLNAKIRFAMKIIEKYRYRILRKMAYSPNYKTTSKRERLRQLIVNLHRSGFCYCTISDK